MRAWHRILKEVLYNGELRQDRTGVGTQAVFGRTLVFHPKDGFPAVTTKKLHFASVAAELACFLKGLTTLEEFHAEGCNIWDANAEKFGGQLGRIYGVQWRDWQSVEGGQEVFAKSTDQIKDLLAGLRAQPHGRRHLVTAWNPGELSQVCLPPCHTMFQVYLGREGLQMSVHMRSVDLFLGLPFDIASFALLQRLLVQELGDSLQVGALTFFLGDAHIYLNHFEQVRIVLAREPKDEKPWLVLDPAARLLTFSGKQAILTNYEPWPAVPATMNP